jgi:FdhD protein
LAVDLADQVGMTLVGFLRGDTMNVYTHAHRVSLPTPAEAPASAAGPAQAEAPTRA